jgi:hypothetical protein
MHVGHFTHPVDDWELDVTRERMDKWVGAFKAMNANGVNVPHCKDHSLAADDYVCDVVDLFRQGDTLYAVYEATDEDDAIEQVKHLKHVSVGIDDFTDGSGTHYGEAITHVASVPDPVVRNQKPFVSIAASAGRAARRARVLFQSTGAEQNDMTPEQLKKLTELLGVESL